MEIYLKSMHLPAVLSLKNEALPDGISVLVPPVFGQRDGLSEAWTTAIFTIVAGVPASVIAGMLVEKFKNKTPTVITINRKEVHLEEGEIIRVIEETKKIEY